MNTKPLKSLLQKGKDDQHIPPIAGALFAIFLIIAIAGAILGDGRYAEWLVGAWVLGWSLVGISLADLAHIDETR